MKRIMIAFGTISVAVAGIAAWTLVKGPWDETRSTPIVDTAMHGDAAAAPAMAPEEIAIPRLGAAASNGQADFDANCASCHGRNAAGTDKGPPLVHRIYEPSHHADFAFVRAVRNGVRSHHWRFGNMPPVEGVTDKQIEWIVKYVREVQRANGIN